MHNYLDSVIAISITTHNRPAMLEYCLRHFRKFRPLGREIILVSDDASSLENAGKNAEICSRYNVFYLYSKTRLGIAKNKNSGITYLNSFPYDYLFMFDDDCFPIHFGWDLPFIQLFQRHQISHSMYLVEAGEVRATETDPTNSYQVFNNCGGYCLFFTKESILTLKGMDPNFGIYGFEHAELSNRAALYGFTKDKGKYICPVQAKEYLFSYDMDKGWLGKESPLGPFTEAFTSSIEDERPLIDGYIDYNRKIYLNT